MVLNKYIHNIILKELCLRNFDKNNILFLNLPQTLKLKIFFPINNYLVFKTQMATSLVYSYFFYFFISNNFNLKFSFSKKIFVKRRKTKIKRHLNGFFFSLDNYTNNFCNFNYYLQYLLYSYSNIFLNSILFKSNLNRSVPTNYLNIFIDINFFFFNYYNNLLVNFKLSNGFFISFSSDILYSNIYLFFFLRSLGFLFSFKKLSNKNI
jgi:hypothetical protein